MGSTKLDVDYILRLRGFRIWSRPSTGPNTWKRNGVEWTEEKALKIAQRELKEMENKK